MGAATGWVCGGWCETDGGALSIWVRGRGMRAVQAEGSELRQGPRGWGVRRRRLRGCAEGVVECGGGAVML